MIAQEVRWVFEAMWQEDRKSSIIPITQLQQRHWGREAEGKMGRMGDS